MILSTELKSFYKSSYQEFMAEYLSDNSKIHARIKTKQSLSFYYCIHQETLRRLTVMIIGNNNLAKEQ